MKLIKFNANTAKSVRTGEAYVRLNKSGVITISPEAVRRMGLVEGDQVSIGQDPEVPEDWYVYHDKKEGFVTRCSSNNNGLTFNASAIFKAFCDCFDITCISVSVLLANKPTPSDDPELKGVNLFCLLTTSMKINAGKEEVAE